jgi:hypothetical protein
MDFWQNKCPDGGNAELSNISSIRTHYKYSGRLTACAISCLKNGVLMSFSRTAMRSGHGSLSADWFCRNNEDHVMKDGSEASYIR